MDLNKAVEWRYAVQMFDKDKDLSKDKLDKILDTARKAPSSYNFQPWKFIVVEDEKLKKEIYKVGYEQPKILDAPVLVVIAARSEMTREDADKVIEATSKQREVKKEDLDGYREMLYGSVDGKPGKAGGEWAKRQSYIALGFLLAAAAVEEVDAGPMEGFIPEKVDEILGLGEMGFTSASMVALGYRSEKDIYADLPKVRFELDEVVETV